MRLFYQELEPLSRQATIVVGLTVVGFMAFGLSLSFYRNVVFDEQLSRMSAENDDLKRHIDLSRSDLDYYRSARYKDRYAKENLGRLSPGERILIITQGQKDVFADGNEGDFDRAERAAAFEQLLRTMPVIEHWKLFLFYRDRIDEMRQNISPQS